MSCRKCYLTFALAALAVVALASDAVCAEKIKVLLLGGGGHDLKGFNALMTEVLEKTGDFKVTFFDKLDDLKRENISKYDVVLFYGSGGNFTDPAQEKGLDEFVNGGGGLAGVHATDSFKKSDVFWKLLGGRFSGHGGGPWPWATQAGQDAGCRPPARECGRNTA